MKPNTTTSSTKPATGKGLDIRNQETESLDEYIQNVPNISGSERLIDEYTTASKTNVVYLDESRVPFDGIKSACAIALHMHQPLIPAGGNDPGTAEIVSNLQYMMNNQGIGDNHNASVFVWCYKRMGEIIPQLINEGKEPRVMLEYSGTLLHGMRKMGLNDVFESLKKITNDHAYRHAAEWLGCPWGHAVAPSTPIQDYRLHVKAFRNHFAAIFGLEALSRIRGFSPSEMALPNEPDVAYQYVKTLKDNGYQWVLVQEHTIEMPETGNGPERKHLPHRLVCRNSEGKEVSIIAIIKTQGSDTKLVAQMQPYYEAKSVSRWELGGKQVPPLVTQIADGENGGVMMNEFPPKYSDVVREAAGSDTVLMNVTEYLEHLFAMGIKESDFPVVQPLFQKRIWERFTPGDGPEKLHEIIEELRRSDHRFHMEGGSWTSNISWVQGYANVLDPMMKLSSMFNEKVLKPGVSPSEHRFRNALFHLLVSQTSCFRYWGQGEWTNYAIELCRRGTEILTHDF